MDISLIISILALFISTILAIIKIFEYRRDRANIILKCEADQYILAKGGPNPYKDGAKYFVVTVMNRGRRPVTITRVSYIPKNKKDNAGTFFDSFAPGFRELTEGKSTQYLAEQSKIPLEKIKYIVAIDTTDRQYKVKLKLKK
ncbi:MAG: hypothetical protein ABIC36_02660 [bacterium]|nr:hypothetical protein [Patescibacteria group bacterium]